MRLSSCARPRPGIRAGPKACLLPQQAGLDRGGAFVYKAAHAERLGRVSANYRPGGLSVQPPGLSFSRWSVADRPALIRGSIPP